MNKLQEVREALESITVRLYDSLQQGRVIQSIDIDLEKTVPLKLPIQMKVEERQLLTEIQKLEQAIRALDAYERQTAADVTELVGMVEYYYEGSLEDCYNNQKAFAERVRILAAIKDIKGE